MRASGLATASSIGITVYTIILFLLLVHRTKGPATAGVFIFFLKVTIASSLAGIACWKLIGWLGDRISWTTFHGAFVDLSLTTIAGFTLIVLLAMLFGVKEVSGYLKRLVSRFAM